MTRKKKRWLLGIALGVVVVGATVAFASRSKGPAATKDETPIGKVAIADVQVEVTEIGTVEPEVKVDVKSALSGKVVGAPHPRGRRRSKGPAPRRHRAGRQPGADAGGGAPQRQPAGDRLLRRREGLPGQGLELLKAGLLSQEHPPHRRDALQVGARSARRPPARRPASSSPRASRSPPTRSSCSTSPRRWTAW